MENVRERALRIIKEIELGTSIYDLEICNIKIWWFIRVHFYLKVVRMFQSGETNISQPRKNYSKSLIKGIVVIAARTISGLLWFVKNRNKSGKIMFITDSHSFRGGEGAGVDKNIFIGPFYKYFKEKAVTVELLTETSLNIKSLADKKEVLFSDFAYVLSFLKSIPLLLRRNKTIGIEKLEKELNSLDINDINREWILSEINNLISANYRKIVLQVRTSETVLNIFKPELIVETVSYNDGVMAFNYIAHKKGIKVYELQHGIISNSHIGYKYFIPESEKWNLIPLPDKVFLFGDSFIEAILSNGNGFKPQNLTVIGYPRLQMFLSMNDEERVAIKEKVRRKLGIGMNDFLIVFTLQPMYTEAIYSFIKDLIPELNENIYLCVKLHPFTNLAKETFSFSENSRVKIVDDRFEDLYYMLVSSDVHCTISSTVFLEAMAIGVPNIIFKAPGFESTLELADKEILNIIDSKEQFIDLIEKIRNEPSFREALIKKAKLYSDKFFKMETDPVKIFVEEVNRVFCS